MKTLKALTLIFFLTGVNYLSAQIARLQVIHNAADIAADPVDIYLDGNLLLDDFGFREATPFIDVPAGVEINIGVAAGNSSSTNDTLKNFNLTLENGGTYVAIANGVLAPPSYAVNPDGRNTSFTLLIKSMARESGTTSDVDFFVLHGSTDAPTVDVIARGVATLVDDASYSDITGYITVPASSYILDVTPGNDNNTIVASFQADLSGLGGGSAVVFASGFLNPAANQNGESFGLFYALSDGSVGEFPAGPTDVKEVGGIVPETFNLLQNYPNPFNPNTTINFTIPKSEFVTLKIYNVLGREVEAVINRNLTAGTYSYNFNAENLASGVYYYELKAGSFRKVSKMNLIK